MTNVYNTCILCLNWTVQRVYTQRQPKKADQPIIELSKWRYIMAHIKINTEAQIDHFNTEDQLDSQ